MAAPRPTRGIGGTIASTAGVEEAIGVVVCIRLLTTLPSANDGMHRLAEQPDGTKGVALDGLGVQATLGREVELAESSEGTAMLHWNEVHENYAITHTVLLSVADREGETMDQAVSRLRREYLGSVLGSTWSIPMGGRSDSPTGTVPLSIRQRPPPPVSRNGGQVSFRGGAIA